MTAPYIVTEATEIEAAAKLLLEKRGARAEIEIVDRRTAYLHPPTRPVIRVAGIDQPSVSKFVGGGMHSRTGGLVAGSVLVGFYGTDQVDLVGVLLQRSLAAVDERHRGLAEGVDLYELVIKRGGGGTAGPLAIPYTSVVLELGVLPAVPVLGQGYEVRSMATSIVGELALRQRGELLVNSELVDFTSSDSEFDEDGVVQRRVEITTAVWPVHRTGGPRLTLAYAWERAEAVLQGLSGRAWPQAGRITAVEVVEHATSADGGAIEIKIGLTLVGRTGEAK